MERSSPVAMVTGGAGALGRAVATALSGQGFHVVVADLDPEAASAVAEAVDGTPLAVDVGDEDSVAEALSRVASGIGRLDALVVNAGISGARAPVGELPLAEWERTLRINLTGAFLTTSAALPLLRSSDRGRIVMVGSQAARGRTGTGKAHYAASKGGLLAFARVLADELGPDGITVNTVAPSRTDTPLTRANAAGDPHYYAAGIAQTALGRLAVPEDTAAAVAWLCSDAASFVTGAVIDVTGGAFMP